MLTCQPYRTDCIDRSTSLGKVILAVLLVAVLALSCFVLLNNSDTSSADPPTSGTCGENLNWEYNTAT
ncbi:MAG: hypothetical protein IK043_00890, partial [Candidatus Methanomethylophilaceae archaeon]|nr:hypothetical protein [Candidatus Methanomethylophilaceae archaeon]